MNSFTKDIKERIERGTRDDGTRGSEVVEARKVFVVRKRFSDEHRNLHNFWQAINQLIDRMNNNRSHGGIKPLPIEGVASDSQVPVVRGAVVRYFAAKKLLGEYEDIEFMMQIMPTKNSATDAELEDQIEKGTYQLGARAVMTGMVIELFTLDLYPKGIKET